MIRGEMPSLESQQDWGSSGSRAGEEWGREQREMGHPEQGTSVFSTNVLMKCSVVSMWSRV